MEDSIRKRRWISFVVALFYLLIWIAPGSMAEHFHDWSISSQTTYAYEYYMATSEGHIYRVFNYKTCAICGQDEIEINENYPPMIYPHDYSIYVGDAGHAGYHQHGFYYRCSECGRQTIRLFYCGGPPCETIIYRLIPIQNEEE